MAKNTRPKATPPSVLAIAQSIEITNIQNSEGRGPTTDATASPATPQLGDNASGQASGPLGATDVAASETLGQVSEIHSANSPESDQTSGAGNAASPAAGALVGEIGPEVNIAITGSADRDDMLTKMRSAIYSELDLRQQLFHAQFPKLAAFGQAAMDAEQVVTGIRITARVNGRRRGGMRHQEGTTEYPADAFTPEQLEQLLSDDDFTLELI